MNGSLLKFLVGFVVMVGAFFLGSYLLMLAYNASVPELFSGARKSERFWTFVVFALFLVLAGAFLTPFGGVLGGIYNRPRFARSMRL